MKISHLYYCLFFLIISCINNDYSPELLKPNAKKELGEILFAMPQKYWKSELGISIRNSFGQLNETTPLPYEKEYEVDFIVPNGVVNNIKINNCIIFIDIEKFYSKNQNIQVKRDLWAKGQLIIELQFSSHEKAIEYFKKESNQLKRKINQFYNKIIQTKYSTNNELNKYLTPELNLKFLAPNKMKLNKKGDNFWWFSKLSIKKDQNGPHEIQQGIFIYKYPYINQKQFSKEYQLRTRDSICEVYVTGKNPETYMEVRKDGLNKTSTNTSLINEEFQFKVAGSWRVVNDKMGGPFVSISKLNADKTFIITMDCYVYAPNFKKQNLLRELEAIVYSAK